MKNLYGFVSNGFVAPVHLTILQRCQKEVTEYCCAPFNDRIILAARTRLKEAILRGHEKARESTIGHVPDRLRLLF